MSTDYPGIPTVARRYWRDYTIAVSAAVLLLFFTGAVAAFAVNVLLPGSEWFLFISATGLVFHFAALFLKDVWRGEYEPEQTTYSSAGEMLALIIVVGTFLSTLLLIGTYGAHLIAYSLGMHPAIAAFVAAYYPVADILLMRRKHHTPGAIALIGSVLVINTAINIHHSVIEVLPVVGKRHRPHS